MAGDSESLDVSHPASGSIPDGHPFEGTSSFTKQSLAASESAQVVSLSIDIGDDSALHQLQKAVTIPHTLAKGDFLFHKSVSTLARPVQPLPVALVACILRRMRGMCIQHKKPILLFVLTMSSPPSNFPVFICHQRSIMNREIMPKSLLSNRRGIAERHC